MPKEIHHIPDVALEHDGPLVRVILQPLGPGTLVSTVMPADWAHDYCADVQRELPKGFRFRWQIEPWGGESKTPKPVPAPVAADGA
jgi:hypothetical protein